MANETVLDNLINPQVLRDLIKTKLTSNMVYAPLAVIDNTLVGQAGDTVTLPAYAYIGDATDVDELDPIPVSELTASTQQVKVKKIGRGVTLSIEAIKSAAFDPERQIVDQIVRSLDNKQDNDVLAVLNDATLIHPVINVTPEELNNALTKYGEDIHKGETYVFVSAATYTVFRAAKEWIPPSEIAAKTTLDGVLGKIYGCYVKVSDKITTTNTGYIVKLGGPFIYNKADVEFYYDFNNKNQAANFYGTRHYAAYLGDPSKVIKFGAASMVTLTVKQITNIVTNKAKFAITGYPTNLPYGWKAWYAQNLDEVATPTVGDTFDNGAGKTHAAFSVEYSEDPLAATDNKYSQILYVDAAGKIRAKGGVKAATTLT